MEHSPFCYANERMNPNGIFVWRFCCLSRISSKSFSVVGGKHGSRHHSSHHHHGNAIPAELIVGALNGGHQHSYASNYGGGYGHHGGVDTATIVSAALGGNYNWICAIAIACVLV